MFRNTRTVVRHLAAVGALLFLAAPMSAQATHSGPAPHAVNTTSAGLALHGYDPVSYFTDGKAVAGAAAYTAQHDGATYRFASAAHRETFLAAPAKYSPQYGGFCAMGAAMGKRLDVDPTLFKVVDGKLYLNVNKGAQGMWAKDVAGNVSKADAQWPALKTRSGFDKM